ncbi:MAG: MFS transporter [Armatimonadota bacterium]|nr:MAG: MFS transporter [Armatimonadota bacterium]
MTAAEANGPRGGDDEAGHWRRTLYGMWLAMFFVFLEWTFAMTFLPVFLQEDIGLSFKQAQYWTGLMMALPSLAMFLAQPLWGLYSDRHGRKRIVIISVIFTSLLRAMWAFAHTPWTLVGLGVAAGVLGSGVIAGQAIVASAAPRHRMGEAMGTLQTSMAAGFLIGPVVGQACAGLIGARPTFLIQALFALIGAITVWLAVQERFDRPAQLEKVTVLGAITRDLRPLVGNRQLQALWVMAFVVFFGFSSMWPILTYFVQFIGVPMNRVAAYAAYIMFVTGSLQTVAAPLFGRMGDRIGQKKVLVATTALCGAFLVPHYFVKTYAQFFVLRVLATAPGAGINPTTSALVARTMPRSRYGGAYGVLASARALAGSVGPLVGGTMAAFVGIRWVFVWTGLLTIVAALWATAAVREGERAPTEITAAP